MPRTFHVYIMASESRTLYIGVTNALPKRVGQHRDRLIPGFTQRYNITRLVWLEPHATIRAAIAREKQIKAWRRAKKVRLIESLNPYWEDLHNLL